MSLPVGADIESICGKCGDVWHVVVAKVGETIKKVVCKQCGGQHRYKPPEGKAAQIAPTSAHTAGKTTRAKAAGTAKKAARAADGPIVKAAANREIRDYRASERYTTGDRIAHATFGEGIVELSPGPGKIQVWFDSGRKILVAAK